MREPNGLFILGAIGFLAVIAACFDPKVSWAEQVSLALIGSLAFALDNRLPKKG